MSIKVKEVDPKDITEVSAYVDANAKVEDFKQQYADVFKTYEGLITDRNDKLEAAEKVVRAHKVTCGPFVLYQHQTKYNAQAFYDAVGREDFLKLGGSVKTIPEYDIDKSIFEAMAAQKKITPSVIEAVKVTSPRYKCPSKLSI